MLVLAVDGGGGGGRGVELDLLDKRGAGGAGAEAGGGGGGGASFEGGGEGGAIALLFDSSVALGFAVVTLSKDLRWLDWRFMVLRLGWAGCDVMTLSPSLVTAASPSVFSSTISAVAATF